jgi:hypothetical protein
MLKDLAMDIALLKEIKTLAAEALHGRTKLEKMHRKYVEDSNKGNLSKAQKVNYDIQATNSMETVTPCEKKLREILIDTTANS